MGKVFFLLFTFFILLLFHKMHTGTSPYHYATMPMNNGMGNTNFLDKNTFFNHLFQENNFLKNIQEVGFAGICGTCIIYSIHLAAPKGKFDQVTWTGIIVGSVGFVSIGFFFYREQNFKHMYHEKNLNTLEKISVGSLSLEKIVEQQKFVIEQHVKTVEKITNKYKKLKMAMENNKKD